MIGEDDAFPRARDGVSDLTQDQLRFADVDGVQGGGEIEELEVRANRLLERIVALPAQTQTGRAAKVRTLLSFALGPDWRGAEQDLDYDIALARAVLGEFAGMSPQELAAV